MTLLVFTPGSFREAAVQILWEQPSEEIQAFVHEPGAFKFLTTIETHQGDLSHTLPKRGAWNALLSLQFDTGFTSLSPMIIPSPNVINAALKSMSLSHGAGYGSSPPRDLYRIKAPGSFVPGVLHLWDWLLEQGRTGRQVRTASARRANSECSHSAGWGLDWLNTVTPGRVAMSYGWVAQALAGGAYSREDKTRNAILLGGVRHCLSD
eukprot:839641-Rhodomonas_salina.1